MRFLLATHSLLSGTSETVSYRAARAAKNPGSAANRFTGGANWCQAMGFSTACKRVSTKLQTVLEAVWWQCLVNMLINTTREWLFQLFCSSQPSMVEWLSSPIFPCSVVVRPEMVTFSPPPLLFIYVKKFSLEDFALWSKLWPANFWLHRPIFAGNSRSTRISQLRAGKTRSKRSHTHFLSTGHLLPHT